MSTIIRKNGRYLNIVASQRTGEYAKVFCNRRLVAHFIEFNEALNFKRRLEQALSKEGNVFRIEVSSTGTSLFLNDVFLKGGMSLEYILNFKKRTCRGLGLKIE